MRRSFLFVHRWLGLTAGLVFAIASLTGGILVYQDELDALIGGPRFPTTPGLIGPAEIEAAIERARPGSRPLRVIWPAGGANILNVRVTDGRRQQDFILDAGSGNVQRSRPLHILLRAMRGLHANLLLGPIGTLVVLYASAASILSLALGLWLWWPGIRHLAHAFRIRWQRGLYVLSFDLHQTLGVIALPLLLVMTISGVLFNQRAFSAASQLLHNDEMLQSWAALRSTPSPDPSAPVIGLAQAARLALSQEHDAALRRIEFPAAPDGVVAVWMSGAPVTTMSGTIRIALDRHTGSVLARQRLLYDSDTNTRLHFGSIGGSLIRALYAISCVVGFSLLPTGAVMWWMKRRRVARAAPATEPG
jgi:uncharacterized iron-regulated membrane protein